MAVAFYAKIGDLWGTFNPVHCGHLLIAEAAFSQVQLDSVLWVPAVQPPHKSKAELLSYEHRLRMVKLATEFHPQFAVSTVKRDRAGKSYAVDTLRALQPFHPNALWYWIIGLDAFQSLPRWYGQQELVEQCCWLVAPRQLAKPEPSLLPNLAINSHPASAAICREVAESFAKQSVQLCWQLLQIPSIEISSSQIRDFCRQQRSIQQLVPDPVRFYILQHHLYQTPPL